jgi:hypothetical protein
LKTDRCRTATVKEKKLPRRGDKNTQPTATLPHRAQKLLCRDRAAAAMVVRKML